MIKQQPIAEWLDLQLKGKVQKGPFLSPALKLVLVRVIHIATEGFKGFRGERTCCLSHKLLKKLNSVTIG